MSFQVVRRCHAPLGDAAQGPGRSAEQVEVPRGSFEKLRHLGGPGGEAVDPRPVQVAGGIESDQLAKQAPVRKAGVEVDRGGVEAFAAAGAWRSRLLLRRGKGVHETHPLQEQVQPLDAARSGCCSGAGSDCRACQGAQPRDLEPQVRFGHQTRQLPYRERAPKELECSLAVAL